MDFLPWPFEIRAAWRDDAHLGITIALLFFWAQVFGHRILQRSRIADAFRPAEPGLNPPLVLIDRINTRHQVPNQEPDHQTNNNSGDDSHKGCLLSCGTYTASQPFGKCKRAVGS